MPTPAKKTLFCVVKWARRAGDGNGCGERGSRVAGELTVDISHAK